MTVALIVPAEITRHRADARNLLRRLAGAAMLTLALGACSTIGDFFSGEDSGPPTKSDKSAADKGDPNSPPKLSTVPDRPKTQTNPTQRQAITQGLRGDKDNAKYAADVTPVDESADAKLGSRLSGAPPANPQPNTASAPPAPGRVTSAPVGAPPPAAGGGPAPVGTGTVGFAGGGSSLEVAVIQFGRGSAQLSGEDRGILREVAQIHKRNGGKVRVVGYVGDDPANVSLARANAVAAELMRNGVARDAIQASAGNEASSGAPGTEIAAADRKAEIFLDF